MHCFYAGLCFHISNLELFFFPQRPPINFNNAVICLNVLYEIGFEEGHWFNGALFFVLSSILCAWKQMYENERAHKTTISHVYAEQKYKTTKIKLRLDEIYKNKRNKCQKTCFRTFFKTFFFFFVFFVASHFSVFSVVLSFCVSNRFIHSVNEWTFSLILLFHPISLKAKNASHENSSAFIYSINLVTLTHVY